MRSERRSGVRHWRGAVNHDTTVDLFDNPLDLTKHGHVVRHDFGTALAHYREWNGRVGVGEQMKELQVGPCSDVGVVWHEQPIYTQGVLLFIIELHHVVWGRRLGIWDDGQRGFALMAFWAVGALVFIAPFNLKAVGPIHEDSWKSPEELLVLEQTSEG